MVAVTPKRKPPVKHRRLVIAREGWHYLVVMAFIVGGAMLREVNLLYMLAGMMLGAFLVNARMASFSLKRIDVRRRLPSRVQAGEKFTVQFVAENQRPRYASWAVAARDFIEREGGERRKATVDVEVLFPHVPAGSRALASYEAVLPRRGRYQFGPIEVSTKFPLGLLRASATVVEHETMLVRPRLGRLSRHWTRMVQSSRWGSHHSRPKRGTAEGEFYGLREWRSGDSQRWIHWRTTARTGQLVARQFEQQQNWDAALLLDLWRPEWPSEEDLFREERAVAFLATAVVDLCHRGGSQLLVGVAGETLAHRRAAASRMLAEELLDDLAQVRGAPDDRLPQLLDEALLETPRGARLIIISTRPQDECPPNRFRALEGEPRAELILDNALWIDARSDEVTRYFQWQ
jgi:uncharacterized protein (DUF58 family)